MDRYDPEQGPDAQEWLELDEQERIFLVEKYHRDARIPLPKSARRPHAIIHTIVENQLALEDQAVVRDTLGRLMGEGLTRHEAVHAIGSVLAEHLHDLLKEKEPRAAADHARYYDALRQLGAEKWSGG